MLYKYLVSIVPAITLRSLYARDIPINYVLVIIYYLIYHAREDGINENNI